MSLLESLPFIGRFFDKTADIVQEVVLDKDAQNKILESLELAKIALEKELHIKELEIKTIPWVDALHKMGRQLINFLTIVITATLIYMDVDITSQEVLLLGGGNVAYQIIKGKGK